MSVQKELNKKSEKNLISRSNQRSEMELNKESKSDFDIDNTQRSITQKLINLEGTQKSGEIAEKKTGKLKRREVQIFSVSLKIS